MLRTHASKQAIESPIGPVTTNDDGHALLEALDSGVALADWTGRQLIKLQSSQAEAGLANQALGTLTERDGFWSARITQDEYWLIVPTIAGSLPQVLLSQSGAGLVTATDCSHGLAVLLIAGSEAESLLQKLCGLDYSGAAMANKSAAQTSIARVRSTILRRDWMDKPAYLILVDRSVGRYLWEIVLEASREFRTIQIDGAQFPGDHSIE